MPLLTLSLSESITHTHSLAVAACMPLAGLQLVTYKYYYYTSATRGGVSGYKVLLLMPDAGTLLAGIWHWVCQMGCCRHRQLAVCLAALECIPRCSQVCRCMCSIWYITDSRMIDEHQWPLIRAHPVCRLLDRSDQQAGRDGRRRVRDLALFTTHVNFP